MIKKLVKALEYAKRFLKPEDVDMNYIEETLILAKSQPERVQDKKILENSEALCTVHDARTSNDIPNEIRELAIDLLNPLFNTQKLVIGQLHLAFLRGKQVGSEDVNKETWNEEAEKIAREVLYHIEGMYPEVWSHFTKSCRKSVRGNIINQINFLHNKSYRKTKDKKQLTIQEMFDIGRNKSWFTNNSIPTHNDLWDLFTEIYEKNTK